MTCASMMHWDMFERIPDLDIVGRPAIMSKVDRGPKIRLGPGATKWLLFEHDLSEPISTFPDHAW
jgi:hypothetical protein